MTMAYDQNGLFIQGMTGTDELEKFMRARFSEKEIQETYQTMVESAKALARTEKIPPLTAFWRLLDLAYQHKAPPLTCEKGCAHCCHTAVALTRLEWDGILNYVRENGIDLNAVIERSRKTVERVRQTLETSKDLDTVDWHRLVVNQPCPFLGDDGACTIYEARPLDCRMVVAFRDRCESKKLEHAQRGVTVEEAVGATVVARLQHDQTPKFKRRKFIGTQPLRLFQHWLITWQKNSRKK